MSWKGILCVVCLTFLNIFANAQIVIDGTQTVEWNVLNKLAGPGVTISNIKFNSQPINQVHNQIGSFEGSSSNVGLDGGVILSNGNIVSVVGPNDEDNFDPLNIATNPAPTDSDLLQLSSPQPAFDAAILEFTFIPNGDTVEFDFVFASEEYPFVPSDAEFNDVFGFFVAGPGISGPFSSPTLPPFNFPDGSMNVALIPGTTTPVSISTVNSATNSAFFIDNGDGNSSPQNTDASVIQADGFTTPITVKFAVQCGEEYYIKFALGDVFDSAVDSYVFIEEDSFSTIIPTEVVLASGSSTSLIEGCQSSTIEFTRTGDDLSSSATVDLTVSGSAINGVDYTSIPSSVNFPVGEDTISLTISALPDALSEGTETLDIHIENFGSTFCGQPISSDINITIEDNVSAAMTGGGTICPGGSAPVQIDFVGGGPWEIGYTFNSTPVTETITVSPHIITGSTEGTYTLTSVTSNGCAGLASGSATITTATIPTLNITGGGDFCDGSTLTATLTTTGIAPFEISYLINSSVESITVLDNNPVSVTISASSTVTPISIISPSESTCPGSVTGNAIFTKHDAPELTSIPTVGLCSGALAQIPLNITENGPWTVEYNLNSVPQTPIIIASSGDFFETSLTGIYEFTSVTSLSSPFCGKTTSVIVDVQNFTAPTATIENVDTTLCIGANYLMDIEFTGTAPWTFTYSVEGVDQESIQCFQDTVLNITEPGQIILTNVTDANCTGNTSGQTDVHIASPIGNPAPTFINECVGTSVNLITAANGGIDADYNYLWEQDVNFLGSNDNLDVTPTLSDPSSSELFNYLLTISQAECGINYLFAYTVQMNPIPTSVFNSSSVSVCPGEIIPLEIQNSGNGEFEIIYSIDNITQDVIETSQPTYTLLASEAGTYNLEVVQDDFCTNTSLTSSLDIDLFELPAAAMETGDTTLCIGSIFTTDINFTGNGPFTFDHLIDGEFFESITTSDNPYSLDVSEVGVHSIGQIMDANCQSLGTGACGVNYFTTINVELSEEIFACEGEEVEVTPLGIEGGDFDSYVYAWSLDDVVISGDPTLVFNPTQSGTIALTVNDFCEIESSSEANMIVESTPLIVISTENNQVCPGSLVVIDNLSVVDTPNNSFAWNFGDGQTANTMEAVHTFESPGIYDVSLSITTPNGCIGEEVFENMIQVNTLPIVDFTFDPEVGNMSDPEIQFENLSTGISFLKWSFGDGTEDSEINPIHIYPEDRAATYLACLEVTNQHGCSNELCKTVEIEPIYNVFIPTGFTPDGDGVNELFGPVLHTSDIDQYDFVIYDRDGHIVFQSVDPEKKWNGSYLTNSEFYVANGIYTWTLRIKLKNHSDVNVHNGAITVIR